MDANFKISEIETIWCDSERLLYQYVLQEIRISVPACIIRCFVLNADNTNSIF